MSEREEARPIEDKGKDYKTPIVESQDFPEPEPESSPTMTVRIEDEDGNVLMEHKNVLASFIHVLKLDGNEEEGKAMFNVGTAHASEEYLASLVEFIGDHLPEWLKAHPSVVDIIEARLKQPPKVL